MSRWFNRDAPLDAVCLMLVFVAELVAGHPFGLRPALAAFLIVWAIRLGDYRR